MEPLLGLSILSGILSVIFLAFAFFGKSDRLLCYLVFCLLFCTSMFFLHQYVDSKSQNKKMSKNWPIMISNEESIMNRLFPNDGSKNENTVNTYIMPDKSIVKCNKVDNVKKISEACSTMTTEELHKFAKQCPDCSIDSDIVKVDRIIMDNYLSDMNEKIKIAKSKK